MRILGLTVCLLLMLVAPRQAAAVTVSIDTDCADSSAFAGLIDETVTDLTLTGRAPADLLKLIPQLAPNLQRLDIATLILSPARIPDYTFAVSSIQCIKLPDNLTSIGEAAFAGSQLETIRINAQIDSVSPHTFSGCTALSEVSLPESVRAIGQRAFAGCKSLNRFNFPAQLESIGQEAFTTSGLAVADMKPCDKLTRIGEFAFASCPDIERVDLPTHIIYIGEGALLNCENLKTITGGMSVPVVSSLMLAATPALESADFLLKDSDISEIGPYALSGAASITNFNLPSTVQFIGDNAMERMSSLRQIGATAVTEIPYLGNNVWNETPQSEIKLTASADMADQFRTTPQWNQFIIISKDLSSLNDIEDTDDGITVRFEGDNLIIKSTTAIDDVTVHDVSGHLRQNITGINATEAIVPTTEWSSPGAYIVNIQTGSEKAIRQIIRQ